MTDPRDPEDLMASQTMLRIDHSTALSASVKILVWVIAGYIVLLSTFGPTVLDARIERFTRPIAEGLGQVQQTAEGTNRQVTGMITKDSGNDEIANKTRERVATLETLAIRGREERLAYNAKNDERIGKIIDQNSEILRLVISLQAKQEMMLQRQGYNIIPRQGSNSTAAR